MAKGKEMREREREQRTVLSFSPLLLPLLLLLPVLSPQNVLFSTAALYSTNRRREREDQEHLFARLETSTPTAAALCDR